MSSFEDDEDDYPTKRRRTNNCSDQRNHEPVNCGKGYREEEDDSPPPSQVVDFGRGKRRRRRGEGEEVDGGGSGGGGGHDGAGRDNGEGDVKDDSSDEEMLYDSDSDIPLDDIDNMLEEGLREGLEKGKASSHQHSYPTHEERKKIVLKKREQDYFEMLPEGWIEVTHFSGMPIYLHKQSRVCTLSKPYYLGPGSARKHEVPISAIPCLAYKKEIEKEKSQELKENSSTSEEIVSNSQNDCPNQAETNCVNGGSCDKNNQLPIIAKVESVQEAKKEKSLDYMSIREYCSKIFEFQEITIRKFKTWADRRRHVQLRKMQQRPSLPEGTKLITCPLPKHAESGDPARRSYRKEFVMNPAGKSAVCILHEFVQHAERVQPKYVFKELENASMPYSATVLINEMEYGVGYGSSKKQAKSEAARATLEILIPDIRDMTADGNGKVDTSMQDLTFFDDIKVEDPRVSEMCAKAGQHSPYQILVECLKRNYGMGDTEIKTDVRLVKHQKNEFPMKVAKHSATVICRNKREGKQRAAQAILQLLHPQINSWGSLLRLYGRGSCKTPKEKKEEEQKITELQNTACANRPNYAILNKLREEMLKLRVNNLHQDQSKGPLRLILCTEDKSGQGEGEGGVEGDCGPGGHVGIRDDEMEDGEVDMDDKEETEDQRKTGSDGLNDPEEGELSNSPINPNLCNQTMESIKSFENSLSNVSDNSCNSINDDDDDDIDDLMALPSTSDMITNQRNDNSFIYTNSNTAQANISNVLNISVSSISSNSSCNSSSGEI